MTQTDIFSSLGIPETDNPRRVDARDIRWDTPVCIEGIKLELLHLRDISARADLILERCQIDVLEIQGIKLLRNARIAILDCVVGTIRIRSLLGDGAVNIERLRAGELEIHDAGESRITETVVDDGVTISRFAKNLSIRELRCTELEIRDSYAGANLEIQEVSAQEEVLIRNCEVSSLTGGDIDVGRFRMHGVVVEGAGTPMRLSDLRVRSDLRLTDLHSAGGRILELKGSTVSGDTYVETARSEPANSESSTVLEDSDFGRDLILSSQGASIDCDLLGIDVRGRLRFDTDLILADQRSRVRLRDSSISDVTLPTKPFRNPKEVVRFAHGIFGASNPSSLAAIQSALAAQHRLQEEDQAYAALRNAVKGGGVRGTARRLFLGSILGWGARLVPPVRALSFAVALTAVLIAVTAHGSVSEPAWLGSALAAFGLWTNIGTGFTDEPSSVAYFTLKAACGGLGLALITVVVGIVIRKLVR